MINIFGSVKIIYVLTPFLPKEYTKMLIVGAYKIFRLLVTDAKLQRILFVIRVTDRSTFYRRIYIYVMIAS